MGPPHSASLQRGMTDFLGTLRSNQGASPMKTQDIEYHADGQRLVGQLAVDDAKAGKRPGIIVAHEGGGLSDHAKTVAWRLADAGYVAFALDYYGDGLPLTDISQAMPKIGAWMADPTGIRARAHAALEVL